MRRIVIYSLLLGTALIGCNKDNDLATESTVVDQNEQQNLNPQNDLDRFLEQKIAKPYNIEIAYRFNEKERYWGYVFVPTAYDKAVEFANVFNYLFIEPFVKMTSQEFLREHSFSKVILIGEYAYEAGGTYTKGWALAGVKIHLLNINNFQSNNIYDLSANVLQTLYHEVAHTWHQAKLFPTSFNRISASDYLSNNWVNLTDANALRAGFIQPYCSYNADEDFVETIARYIVYYNATLDCGCSTTDETRWGRNNGNANIPDGFDYELYNTWKGKFSNYGTNYNNYYSSYVWEEQLELANSKIRETETFTGKEKLEQKMVIIKKYLQDEWNINLDALRAEIRSRYPYVVGNDFEGNPVERRDFSILDNN